MSEPLYPLTFEPAYAGGPAAGSLLAEYLGKTRPPPPPVTMCSWELAGAGSTASVIAEGPCAGMSLAELVQRRPHEIVGSRHSAREPFPITVRLLDIGQRQPLTVHPEQARTEGELEAGPRTLFWFSLRAASGSRISAGIAEGVTRQQIMKRLDSPDLTKLLQTYRPRPGDAFFLPSRRAHSLGAGNLVWEICHGSGKALRLSNWGAAPPVPEHEQKLALDAVWFGDRQTGRVSRESGKVSRTRKIPLVRFCPQFLVDEIRLLDQIFDRTDGRSFHLLAAVDGCMEIHTDTWTGVLQPGAVACIPAALGHYGMRVADQPASLLRVMLQPVFQ